MPTRSGSSSSGGAIVSCQYDRIRPDIRAAIDRYAKDGVPVGDFLQAVLANVSWSTLATKKQKIEDK